MNWDLSRSLRDRATAALEKVSAKLCVRTLAAKKKFVCASWKRSVHERQVKMLNSIRLCSIASPLLPSFGWDQLDFLGMAKQEIVLANDSGDRSTEIDPDCQECLPSTTPVARSAIEPLAVNIREAAEMIGVSSQTVQREINRGNLRALKIGRQWRVRIVELSAYLERQENKKR